MTKLSHSFSAIKMYENCPKRYYHQRVLKEVKDQGGEATIWGERVHKFLEDRLAKATELPQEVARYDPLCQSIVKLAIGGELLVEQQLTLNVALEPTSWFSKDAWMRSIVDVLVIRGDEAIMFDWKTGKRRPDFSQLELFALQVFKHYPEVKRVRTAFVWLKDLSMDHETYTRDNEPELWARLMNKVVRIEKSLETDNWPAKPSGLCNWCPCKNFCEYS
jgi:hypothetical protein|tara:strand:+ start:5426 stop:6082 length:657 start_codon:yes stop_codon:yes gene_type:complete